MEWGYWSNLFVFWYSISLIVLSPANCCFSQSASEASRRTALEAATKSLSRLQSEAISYSGTFETIDSDATIQIDILQALKYREIVGSQVIGGVARPFCQIFDRYNCWYVMQEDGVDKYRPYEAPISLPTFYVFLAQIEHPFVTVDALAQASFKMRNNDELVFVAPLSGDERMELRRRIESFEKSGTAIKTRVDAHLGNVIRDARVAVENGKSIAINAENGMLVSAGMPGHRYSITNVKWRQANEIGQLPPEVLRARDHLRPIVNVSRSLNDLAMFGYAAAWRPGNPFVATNTVVLDLRSGEVRRVPFPGGEVFPGCFAQDRKSVYVLAASPSNGLTSVFQVNLEAGTYRQLPAPTPDGNAYSPALSPDGKHLAVLMNNGGNSALSDNQIYLLDLATYRAQKIGPRIDAYSVSWLSDGSGFIFDTSESGSARLTSKESQIVQIDLQGHQTQIRPGSFPVQICDSRRILFFDAPNSSWKTCDRDGKSVNAFGDGLSQFRYPSVAPDGKHILMLRYADSTGPRPYIVDAESGLPTPTSAGQGLWAFPIWR